MSLLFFFLGATLGGNRGNLCDEYDLHQSFAEVPKE